MNLDLNDDEVFESLDHDTPLTNSSDSEEELPEKKFSRLGKCETCGTSDAKYSCPKCEVKSCSLNCSIIHKKELNCNGVRDKTKYIPLKKMTELDFMSDYNFLEECTRYTQARKRDIIKKYTIFNGTLPPHLHRLRIAAKNNKTHLKFLTQNFAKNKINTTRYNFKTKSINWRIEWIFVQAENLKIVTEQANENELLGNLLENIFNNSKHQKKGKKIEFYQSKGLGNLKIMLKSERIPKCRNRYYELECRKNLKDNFRNKAIIEYPEIYVLYDEIDEFNVIDSDEDVEAETKKTLNELEENFKKQSTKLNNIDPIVNDMLKTADDLKKEVENLEVDKELEEKHKKYLDFKNKPKNFLFSSESYFGDDIFSDDDDKIEGKKIQGLFDLKDIHQK